MSVKLRQSTEIKVRMGPFVDATDGVTPETGVTLGAADQAELLKADGAATVDISGATWAAITGADGWYDLTLTTSHTDTVGELVVVVQDSSLCAPVFKTFEVEEEAIYDSLRASGATKLATFAQVSGIGASSGGSLNFAASTDNTGGAIKSITFVGTQAANTYTATESENGVYHQITAATNDIDIVYSFSIGGARTGVEVTWRGYIDGSNDDAVLQVYDFVGADWETIATITGQAGTDNQTITASLLTKHTGTGSDLGTVLIRIDGQNDDSSPTLYTDQLTVAAVNSNTSIGYVNGQVWIDTSLSNTNTESFVDGTADNPVSTIAAAKTIADNLNLRAFQVLPGSSITLAATFDNYEFYGHEYGLALGGQSVSGALFEGANITGNDDGSNTTPALYRDCVMSDCTLGLHRLRHCGLGGASTGITLAEAGTYDWDNCFSEVAGTGTPIVTFGTGNQNLNVRHYSGGLQIENMGASASTDNASVEGWGQVIEGTCTAGTVAIRGNFTVSGFTNLTLSDDARIDVAQINAEADTAISDAALATASALATADANIDAIKAVTDVLPDSGALTSLATAAALTTVDGVVDAIKAKTDSLSFTVANQVDANIQYVNDVAVTGDGQTGTEWGPA